MLNVKVCLYHRPQPRLSIVLPTDIAQRIGRLKLASLQNDDEVLEVTLRRAADGNAPAKVPGGDGRRQYQYFSGPVASAIEGRRFTRRAPAEVSVQGDEINLRVLKSLAPEHFEQRGPLEPLENILLEAAVA